jgi:hypothetical protein
LAFFCKGNVICSIINHTAVAFYFIIKIKKIIIMKLKLSIVMLLLATISFAQTSRFVAMNGNDVTGTGSITNPYLTITKAASVAQPGDMVLVRAGEYRNTGFKTNGIWDGTTAVYINANGSPNNYITFKPYQNEKVLIEFDGVYGVLIQSASYIKFKGFEIKGIADVITPSEALAAWGLYKLPPNLNVVRNLAAELGISPDDKTLTGTDINKPSMPTAIKPDYYNGRALVANNSHHIDIENNIIRDVPSAAIRAQQSDYVNIIGNEVYRCTYWTTQGVGAITVSEATSTDNNTGDKIVIARNKVYENENRLVSWNPTKTFIRFEIDEGTGIFLTRNNTTYLKGKMLIANNLSYKNGASGIVCHFTDRATIEHNTVYDNGTTNDGSPGGIGLNTASDVVVRNNIAYAKNTKWALGKTGGTLTNVVTEANIIFNGNSSIAPSNFFTSGYTVTDPLFANIANNNFKLAANSPAINKGSKNATQTIDFLGNLRNDDKPDIGAYEFFATSSNKIVSSNNQNTGFNVYPNPFLSTVQVSGVGLNETIMIYDMSGRQVKSFQTNAVYSDNIELDLETLPANNIYFLKVGNQVSKLIKQ